MNAVILAAGYATRMYPLTRDFPKPLLEVRGRSILDHLVSQLDRLPQIGRIVLVSNHRFLPAFQQWQARRPKSAKPITLLDDGSTENENRLGALGDLRFALEQTGVDDDLFVTAADNLLRFSLAPFFAALARRRAVWVCVHRVTDRERLRRTGVVVLDAENRVLEFAEKPPDPKSEWAVSPLYLYPREFLPMIRERLALPGLADSPGALIEWLRARAPVHAHPIRGEILDLGNLQALDAARQSR
jgi:glucose-1-phosphate thymidylyltransferase